MPDDRVDLLLEPGDLRGELALQVRQRRAVERDAGRLHPGEDRDEGELDLREQSLHALVAQRLLQRWTDGQRGQRLQPGHGGGRKVGGRGRQDEVQPLRDDVRDLLGAQRGIDEVGGDLGVERHRGGLRVRLLGEPRGEQGLDLVADERRAEALEEMAQRRRRGGALGRDGAAVGPGHRDRERRAGQGPGVVHDERDAHRLLLPQPGLQGGDPRLVRELDPARVHDGRRKLARQVAGRRRDRLGPRLDRGRGRGDPGRRSRAPVGHHVEVHRQLQRAVAGP